MFWQTSSCCFACLLAGLTVTTSLTASEPGPIGRSGAGQRETASRPTAPSCSIYGRRKGQSCFGRAPRSRQLSVRTFILPMSEEAADHVACYDLTAGGR